MKVFKNFLVLCCVISSTVASDDEASHATPSANAEDVVESRPHFRLTAPSAVFCTIVNEVLAVPLTLRPETYPTSFRLASSSSSEISIVENVFVSANPCGCDSGTSPKIVSIVEDLNHVVVVNPGRLQTSVVIGRVKIKAQRVGEIYVFANVSTTHLVAPSPSPNVSHPGEAKPSTGVVNKTTFTPMMLFRVSVVHSFTLQTLVGVIGWVYVFSWCVCFYPQIFELWRTRSSDGFSYDTMLMNIMDQSVMILQTYSIFFSPILRQEYAKEHPNKTLPILPNDLASITHNFFAILVIAVLVKTAYRSQVSQRITWVVLGIIAGSIVALLVGVVLAAYSKISWLHTVFILGYIKTLLGLIKYAPQAVLNWRRKSTEGFAVGMMIFDLAGGVASLLQMIFLAVNNEDGASLTGNPGKFGTGVVTVTFEAIFILQRFIIYPPEKGKANVGYVQI